MTSSIFNRSESNSELDQRIQKVLNAAKMALWEINVSENSLQWTGKTSSHFYDFSRSLEGTLDSYVNKIHPEDLDDVMNVMSTPTEPASFANQHRVMWSDGTYHWLEGLGTISKTKDGTIISGTVQDISEKKRAELDREDWKQKHELVAKAAGVVVYDYNIESGAIEWSGSIKDMFGFQPKEVDHVDIWLDKIHSEDKTVALSALEDAESSMGHYDVIYRFQTKKGDYRNVHDKGFFIGDKTAVKMLGMMADITDIKSSQDALIESEGRFKSMIHDLRIGVGLYDSNTSPLICNRQAYELLGMTEDQFMGRDALDKDWQVLDGASEPLAPEMFPIPRAIESKKTIRGTIMGVFRPSQEDWVWLLVDAEPFYENEMLLHIVCTYSDITELRNSQNILNETNAQLKRLAEELQGRNKRLLEFAQIVSHNLRSPISSIVSLAELHDDSKPEMQERIVEHIDRVGKNALQTIEELNDVLKVQQGDVKKDLLDFEKVLNSVTSSYKGVMSEADITVDYDFKELKIRYPKIYMTSLFMNLLSNSIKYKKEGESGRIKIQTKRTKAGHIRLRWKDNGQGIDLNLYKHDVFQMGKTFHENADGRGVGLFLIRNQIESMGGTIDVESSPGNGATFKVTFID